MGRKLKELPIPLNIKEQLNDFKNRLLNTAAAPNETSEFDVETVRIIMEELSELDRVILFTVYGITDGSCYQASKIWQTSPAFIRNRIIRTLNYIKSRNAATRTTYNDPRDSDYN